jgi:hypothetical protein
VSEIETTDGTRYRFGRDDLVQQLLEGDLVSTYRWRRALDLRIDPRVRVDVDGHGYEYAENEDTAVTLAEGAVPHGITAGCRLNWYEQADDFSDLALVLDADGAVLGGLVEIPEDDDEDDYEDGTYEREARSMTPATPTGLATESAARPLVPILLALVVVAGLVVFLLSS